MRRAIPRRRAARPMDPPIRPTPTIVSVSNTTALSRLQHAGLPRIGKNAPCLNNWGQFAQRLQRPDVTRRVISQLLFGDGDLDVIAGPNLFAKPVRAFHRYEIAAIH